MPPFEQTCWFSVFLTALVNHWRPQSPGIVLFPARQEEVCNSPCLARTKEGSENGKARMCLRRSRTSPNRALAGFDGYVASGNSSAHGMQPRCDCGYQSALSGAGIWRSSQPLGPHNAISQDAGNSRIARSRNMKSRRPDPQRIINL
jgi:hypothetical protein